MHVKADHSSVNTVEPLTFPVLTAMPWLRHGITTRSPALPLVGDMSFTTGASHPESVIANRTTWLATVGATPETTVMSGLIHETHVTHVGLKERGRGTCSPQTAIPQSDGLITTEANVTLLICFADCVPLILVDPKRHAIGLGHAGWRGTLAEMATALVHGMETVANSEPRNLIAVIGPSIGPMVYEVGRDVADQFTTTYPDDNLIQSDAERLRLDLWSANRQQFLRAGLCSENVHVAGICTQTHADRFFSHRYAIAHREREGRFAVMLSIKG